MKIHYTANSVTVAWEDPEDEVKGCAEIEAGVEGVTIWVRNRITGSASHVEIPYEALQSVANAIEMLIRPYP